MGGNSIARSDDSDKILTWLDARQSSSQKVLYVAFGSEIEVGDDIMHLLVGSFQKASFFVLWASKRLPTVSVPESVLVTKFAPQRAVLAHSAVFAFLSHGGAN